MSSLKMVKLLGASWIGAFRVAQKHGKHVFGILILLTMFLCNLVLLSMGGLIEISSMGIPSEIFLPTNKTDIRPKSVGREKVVAN